MKQVKHSNRTDIFPIIFAGWLIGSCFVKYLPIPGVYQLGLVVSTAALLIGYCVYWIIMDVRKKRLK